MPAHTPCTLCGGDAEEGHFTVADAPAGCGDANLALCPTCTTGATGNEDLSGGHWYCLQESIWSEVPAVQVVSYRLLHRLSGQTWAVDLLEQAYLADEVLAWAKEGLLARAEGPTVLDSNGVVLQEGDSVTLIKDLSIKGANFTAKRGTLVKDIHLGDDATHIEGRINRMSIMLKTCFLKRVGG